MRTHPISTLLWTLLVCSFSFAQSNNVEATPIETEPVKTQKYNGYGLPNTKFKKVKLDYSKKKKDEDLKAAPTFPENPIKLTPKPALPKETALASQPPPTPPKGLITFALEWDVSYSLAAEKDDKGGRNEYITHEVLPSISIGQYKLLGDVFYNDDVKNPGANEWQDSSVLLIRSPEEVGAITLGGNGLVTLPLSKETRENVQMKYAAGVSGVLGLNTKSLGLEAIGLNYVLRYTKMVNEFDTKVNGDPVTAYQIKQRINFSYNFTKKFLFKTRFELNSNYSAQNVVRNGFYHYELLNYDFNDHVGVNIGHYNGGNAYNVQEGQGNYYLENNLKFYDPKTSEFFIGIALTI